MGLELSKLQIRLCLMCCVLTIIMILKSFPTILVVSVAALPIAVVIANYLLSGDKRLEEYISYFNSLLGGDEATKSIALSAVEMINSYLKVKSSLDDILYINYNVVVPYKELESMLLMSEDTMKKIMGKIYSRLRLATASGSINEADNKYIKQYFDIGQEAIDRSVVLLNEVSEMSDNNYDLSALDNFIESLKDLNNKVK